MKGKGKVKLLRPGKGTSVKEGVVERETYTDNGGSVKVKVRKDEDGDLRISRRLARLLFNKDWGK